MTDTKPLPHYVLPQDPPRPLGSAFSVNGALVPAPSRLGDLNDPTYWQFLAPYLAPRDVLHVQNEAGLFYAVCLVRSVSPQRTAADIVVLHSWQEDEPEVLERAGMKVEWKAGSWAIVMAADGSTVKDKLGSRGQAASLLLAMTETRPAKGTKAAA